MKLLIVKEDALIVPGVIKEDRHFSLDGSRRNQILTEGKGEKKGHDTHYLPVGFLNGLPLERSIRVWDF